MHPTSIRCVIPSRAKVGERVDLKVKLLGPPVPIPCCGSFKDRKPQLRSPFNLNVARNIQFHDNGLPQWTGRLRLEAGLDADAPDRIEFDGVNQGVFPGDTRPIRHIEGLRFKRPGIYFIRLVDPESGVEGFSNPIQISEDTPGHRIFWGDPHWQTIFSDGIRCPEELYHFARYEGFLDFGAISDHMEAVTDWQWDYFQAVTNACNIPGQFATLIGQEWTHHDPAHGAPGHRNIYVRGDRAPALRSTDPRCNSLEKLWSSLDVLDDREAIAIPHHPANVVMGVDWDQGWNPKYEKAVEIHSVWGNSERHADDGNIMPIEHCRGEMRGRHVQDALKKGFRLGFVGGGDIHDGRPGDPLHTESYPPGKTRFWPSGFTAVMTGDLSREALFDAIAGGRTYATTQSRILLDVNASPNGAKERRIQVLAASEEGIQEAQVVLNGQDTIRLTPDGDPRVLNPEARTLTVEQGDYWYVRVTTLQGNLAWSSPVWS